MLYKYTHNYTLHKYMCVPGVFRDFFADHAHVFANAPEKPAEEQNLEYYDLFQR